MLRLADDETPLIRRIPVRNQETGELDLERAYIHHNGEAITKSQVMKELMKERIFDDDVWAAQVGFRWKDGSDEPIG